MHRYVLSAGLFLVMMGSFGCTTSVAKKPSPTVAVKGTVKLAGAPMKEGEISFSVPGEPVATLPITDGTFSGNAPVGKTSVGVSLFKNGPPRTTDPTGPPTKINTIPPRFNGVHTTLSAEVKADGANEFKFDVTQ